VLHYRVSASDAATVSGGTAPGMASANGSASGSVSLSADIPTNGIPSGADNCSLSFGGGDVLAPGTR